MKMHAKNVPHLEVTEVVLVHCNIVNNNYQQNSKVLYTFVYKTINPLVNCQIFHRKVLYF